MMVGLLELTELLHGGTRELSKDNLWCDRCKEDCFPVATPEEERGRPGLGKFKMGLLYPKSKVPRRLRERLFSGGTSNYACGNCIVDMMNEEDE